MLERRVEFGQRAAAVVFLVQMGEGIAEADDRVILAVDVAVQPAPVGMRGLQDQPARLPVLKRLGHHVGRPVGGGDVEPGFGQAHGVKPGAAGHVEDAFLAAGAQDVDEELPLAFGAGAPVDQLVPFVDEGFDIFLAVVIGFPICRRIIPIDLFGACKLCTAGV